MQTVTTHSPVTTSPMEWYSTKANYEAAERVFIDYLSRRSVNTKRTHAAALAIFTKHLAAVGVPVSAELQTMPQAWAGITWGVISGFVDWMKDEGYAVKTINDRLSTIKRYAKLAHAAGVIPAEDHLLIQGVKGFSRSEGVRLDETRSQTRIGTKKAQHVSISAENAHKLKSDHPTTAQGRRDQLLMCLLLDHGLRVGEVARLDVDNFDLDTGRMTFFRPKVQKTQTHKLSPDTLAAVLAYFDCGDAPYDGLLLRTSNRDGTLSDGRMKERSITQRVAYLGRVILGFQRLRDDGRRVGTLSAHDCRHFCATDYARENPAVKKLCDWFGWNSPAMALRYIESAKVLQRDFGRNGEQ